MTPNPNLTPESTDAEMADGLALWEEYRPRSPGDWIMVAREVNADPDGLSPKANPVFAALCITVAELDDLR